MEALLDRLEAIDTGTPSSGDADQIAASIATRLGYLIALSFEARSARTSAAHRPAVLVLRYRETQRSYVTLNSAPASFTGAPVAVEPKVSQHGERTKESGGLVPPEGKVFLDFRGRVGVGARSTRTVQYSVADGLLEVVHFGRAVRIAVNEVPASRRPAVA